MGHIDSYTLYFKEENIKTLYDPKQAIGATDADAKKLEIYKTFIRILTFNTDLL